MLAEERPSGGSHARADPWRLIPGGEQHEIKVANGEERDTPAMTAGDDELPKLPVLVGSTTGVRREREDGHCLLYSVAESKQARVVWSVACQFALDDVFLESFDVFLERDGRDHPISVVWPGAHLFLVASANRMRCCAGCARSCMPASKSSDPISPAPLFARRNAFLALAAAALRSARNSAVLADGALDELRQRFAFAQYSLELGLRLRRDAGWRQSCVAAHTFAVWQVRYKLTVGADPASSASRVMAMCAVDEAHASGPDRIHAQSRAFLVVARGRKTFPKIGYGSRRSARLTGAGNREVPLKFDRSRAASRAAPLRSCKRFAHDLRMLAGDANERLRRS